MEMALNEQPTRQLEEIYALLSSPAWDLLCQEFRIQYEACDSLVGAHTTEEMWRRSGKVEVLYSLLTLKDDVRDMLDSA